MRTLLLLLAVASCTDAIIGSGDSRTSDRFLDFTGYGYRRGGTLDFTINYSPPDVYLELLLCTDEEIDAYKGVDDLCAKPEAIMCELHVRAINGSAEVDGYSVLHNMPYYLLLGNCELDSRGQTPEIEFSYWYQLMNPGGRHLDSGHWQLPAVYSALLIIWVVMFALWLANWMLHCTQNIPLHRLLTVIPATKLVRLALCYIYWSSWARDGYQPSTIILVATFFSLLVHQAVVVAALTLTAKGWCIARRHLNLADNAAVMSLVGGLWTGLLLNQLFGGMSVVVLGLVYAIIAWHVTRSVWALKVTLSLVAEGDPLAIAVVSKFNMMRNFLAVVLGYYASTAVTTVVSSLFFYNVLTVVVLLHEIVEIFLIAGVGWIFRLRASNPQFRLPNENGLASEVQGHNTAGGTAAAHPWKPGVPVAIELPGNQASSALLGVPVNV